MSDGSLTYEAALQAAAAKGCYVRTPQPNELFVDIDNELDYAVFVNHIDILREHIPVENIDVRPSKSGLPHLHITVRLGRNIQDAQRVALQAGLGSDRKRELLSSIEVVNGSTLFPTLFFELANFAAVA